VPARLVALIGLGDVGRVVGPHVDDLDGDGDGGRRVEHSLDEGEIADRCSAWMTNWVWVSSS